MDVERPGAEVRIRAARPNDQQWIEQLIVQRWRTPTVVVHGTIYHPARLPGLVAEADGGLESGMPVGLLTYVVEGDGAEIITFDSLRPGHGVGTELLAALQAEGQQAGWRRLWLTTTNDNLRALRFYQRRGFVLTTLHREAVNAARALKPEIPATGEDDIPIRDELELELSLTPPPA